MYENYIKRFIDVVGVIILLPLLFIIFIPISLAIKLDDKGPVFYKSKRLGKNYKQYNMYKFRSMKVNSRDIRNKNGTTFNASDDPRVTRVGKFLRKTSIDELPQIINVLIGDMSFVGPRPSPLGNIALYSEDYFRKFNIRPGVTGFAQANYRNKITIPERQRADLYYVDNISLWLDIQVMLKTVSTVLLRKNLFANDVLITNEEEHIKKILFISNISKRITNFTIPSILASTKLGYEFHLASNQIDFINDTEFYIKTHHLDIERNPLSIKNIRVLFKLIRLIKREKYDVIHCNTPVGGILGRIAGKVCRVERIIYSAHGFHFYKGAPLINKIYKFIEWFLSKETDAIITMNAEDYDAAKRFKKDTNVYFINGVGVDTSEYGLQKINSVEYRKSLKLDIDDIILISMGDLIKRKNYKLSIEVIKLLNNPKVHLLICGCGSQLNSLHQQAIRLGIESQIHFLGFRKDIKELLNISDIFLFTSSQEGLPRSLMEAMASGLPCIVSKIRGNIDLIEDGKGGYLCDLKDKHGFVTNLNCLIKDKNLRRSMGIRNKETIKNYDIKKICIDMENIYRNELIEKKKSNTRKITFVIGSMRRGGAERVINILANHYSSNNWSVEIITLLDTKIEYPLRKNIKVVHIVPTSKNKFSNTIFWILNIRKQIKKSNPRIIVSFIGRINLLTLLSCMGINIKIIISERNDPLNDGRSKIILKFQNILYKRSDNIVFQSVYQQNCFDKEIREKGTIIKNPIEVSKTKNLIKNKTIVSVGRLVSQKNQKLLIDAFSKIHTNYPLYNLVIYGEGSLRSELEKYIEELGLDNKIELPGVALNIHDCVQQADIFVLPSNYEGLSNALLEAMMLGVPCVATNYAGINEVIKNGVNGFVVPRDDVNELADVLKFLLDRPDLASFIGDVGKKTVNSYKKRTVIKEWTSVIERGF